MKKNILCAFVAAFALAAQASWVTKTQARQAALAWAEQNGAFGVEAVLDGSPVKVADTNGVPLWYYVQMQNDRCLVVAPATELEPVIAVLESVPEEGLPTNHPMYRMLVCDMRDRLKKLDLYSRPPAAPSLLAAAPAPAPADPSMAAWAKDGEAKWAKLLPQGGPRLMAAPTNGVADADMALKICVLKGFEQGGPLTHWNQGTVGNVRGAPNCYNYYTPNNYPCGCVATAMAAMMQYYGVNAVKSGLQGVSGPCLVDGAATDASTLLSDVAEFAEKQLDYYDWSLVEGFTAADYKNTGKMTEKVRQLLGRVTYDAGVMVSMSWAADGSSAQETDIAAAFRSFKKVEIDLEAMSATSTDFGACAVRRPTEDQYAKLIYNPCRAGMPVGLGIIQDGESTGHSVVVVGYGKDDEGNPRVRVFTGWGGMGDGWYALPYINTKSLPSQAGNFPFDVVQSVVTLVGYDTEGRVPVVGRVMKPGAADKLTVRPQNAETPVDPNGYFGIAVPHKLPWVSLAAAAGAEAKITLDPDLKDCMSGIVDGARLCAALPDEIYYEIMNCRVAYSLDQALDYALAENRAILRVSGTMDEEATSNLVARIRALDAAGADFRNRYVYFFSPYSPSGSDFPDGNPSFGVFLAEATEQAGRWRYENGRLSYGFGYSNVLRRTTNDYDETSADEDSYAVYEYVTNAAYHASVGSAALSTFETNSFPYTTAGMLDALDMVLDGGWAEYERQTHDISLTVTAPYAFGAPDPAFGAHTGLYRNGQTVTATAPGGEVTNAAQTVVVTFDGWTLTNETTGASRTGTGTTATFAVAANDVLTLIWQTKPKLVKIEIEDRDYEGVTEPGTGWYPYGKPVSFVATPDKEMGVGGFDQWMSLDNGTWPAYLDRTSAVLTFTVIEPLRLQACYGDGPAEAPATTNFPVRVMSVTTNMDALTDAALPSVRTVGLAEEQSVQMGGTIELPNRALSLRLAAATFTNSQGTWRCVGWILQPDGAGSAQAAASGTTDVASFTPAGAAVLTWVWAREESVEPPPKPSDTRRPLVDPDDVPAGTTGAGSSPITITPNADGTLTVAVTVGNAVKGYWYDIVTDTNVDGAFTTVLARVLAKADGELDLGEHIVDPADGKRFFKVRIEED